MGNKKRLLYFICSFTLFLTACQKEDITGDNDYKALGFSAKDLLTATPYSLLQVQIDYMPGNQPDDKSIDGLTIFLKSLINKPGGIQVTTKEIAPSGKTTLSVTDIVSIEKKNRSIFTGGTAIGVHILITDADYNLNDILATSYWNTSICIFGKKLNENSGGSGQVSRTTLLTTIFEHEFGHLMGLVNQGSPMQVNHRDPDNGAHCNNPDCLMFYDIESINAGGNNLTAIPMLDENCKNDLRANGGK